MRRLSCLSRCGVKNRYECALVSDTEERFPISTAWLRSVGVGGWNIDVIFKVLKKLLGIYTTEARFKWQLSTKNC